MLEQNNPTRADLKERELKLKSEELQLQNKKFEQEAAKRNERLKLELEERRMFLQILKEKCRTALIDWSDMFDLQLLRDMCWFK